ncbi:hypothetical protein ACFPYI_09130 [Halomarina salina]|uniref:Uncharacterized protein n=1 Tax=Halomarina salina TaxID=1872699 RepID=A0ABD5RM41_9EURY|nr:hypothetical protein [Halomarina salina]
MPSRPRGDGDLYLTNLTANSEGDGVRRETRGAAKVLVAPMTFLKATDLHRGYVPAAEVRASAEQWDETPITLTHPMANGRVTSVDDPTGDAERIGHIENPRYVPGEHAVQGDAVLYTDVLTSVGGDALRLMNKLTSNRAVGVSSSYFGESLPPGHYDGEYREQVKGGLRPDHVALLKGNGGVCSIQDGCAAGAPAIAANAHSDGIATSVGAVEAERERGDRATPGDNTTRDGTSAGIPTSVSAVEAARGDDSAPSADPDAFPALSVGARMAQTGAADGDAGTNGGAE